MFKRISRIAISLIGAGGGLALAKYLIELFGRHDYFGADYLSNIGAQYAISILIVALCGLIAWFLSKPITSGIILLAAKIDAWQADKSISDLWITVFALILGLLIAYLLGNLTRTIPSSFFAFAVGLLTYLICPYVCARIAWKRRADVPNPFRKKDSKDKKSLISIHIIDTSAIIDGRITDICKTGFLDGKILVPEFVINDLRRICDSDDPIKRNRGRRGLDLLNELENNKNIAMEVCSTDYSDVDDIDIKLVRLSLEKDASLITNDYNLNKTAVIHKVKVLNINELANAVKTVLLPGEMLNVRILKQGKEPNQGVAYLEDGTMIVIENGGSMVGEKCSVCVTTVLQTAAGKMIFAKYE